jgi:hypothetical protein
MIKRSSLLTGRFFLGGSVVILAQTLGCSFGSSSLFNPAFNDLFDPTGTGENASIDNPTGYDPVLFVNNLRFGPQLTAYMAALNADRRLSGVPIDVTNLATLKPRVRIPMQITFDNGNFLNFEFVDGDGVFEVDQRNVDEDGDGGDVPQVIDPQLTENDLTRMVATCAVARVEIIGDPQVFVPVFVRTLRIDTTEFGGRRRLIVRIDPPQFRPILPDEVDDNLNVTLLRNYGFREAPAPAQDLTCGAMVGLVLNGTVTIPFTAPEAQPDDDFIAAQDEVPGFLDTDLAGQASVPGRFSFTVDVR